MTDEEAMAAARETHYTEANATAYDYFDDGFRAGLAHARQWRPLTEDPATWPEVGAHVLVYDAPQSAAHIYRLAVTGDALRKLGWTHWAPLPAPPEQETP